MLEEGQVEKKKKKYQLEIKHTIKGRQGHIYPQLH